MEIRDGQIVQHHDCWDPADYLGLTGAGSEQQAALEVGTPKNAAPNAVQEDAATQHTAGMERIQFIVGSWKGTFQPFQKGMGRTRSP